MKINEAEISREHYFDRSYLKRERLYSFIEQIELVKKYSAPSDKILEVGKGNGFVSRFLGDYLRYQVKSCDVNENLHPDFSGDISSPKLIESKTFDVVTCFEVLEHMPIEKSARAVVNMCQIARKYILVSVPDMRYFLNLRLLIFGSLPLKLGRMFSTRRFRRQTGTFGKGHHWEIGIKTNGLIYSAEFVRKKLFPSLKVIEDYRCPTNPWHHYFVIRID